MIELKDTINDHLTTWTEWTSCSPYCKRSRYRVCSGEFKCYNEADGVSEPVLCTGRSWAIIFNIKTNFLYNIKWNFHLVNLWKDNCEAEHEECEWDQGECFKELRDDRLPINPKENPNYGGRQLDDSPKLCYDEYNNNYLDHPRSRRAIGASSESYIWPWMYRLNGKNSEGEFFCSANQIGRNLLVTGKI